MIKQNPTQLTRLARLPQGGSTPKKREPEKASKWKRKAKDRRARLADSWKATKELRKESPEHTGWGRG